MSRYDDLAKKAANWSKQFYAHREACQKFAQWMAGHYAIYLDAPKDCIEFLELDRDLASTGKFSSMTGLPVVTNGNDGFEYFGLSVLLKTPASSYSMSERVVVGLKLGQTEWVLLWNDTRYVVPLSDIGKVELLFEVWGKMSLEKYEGPVAGTSNSIGFIAAR